MLVPEAKSVTAGPLGVSLMRELVMRGGGNVGIGVAVGVPDSAVGVGLGISVGVGGQVGVRVKEVVAPFVTKDACPSFHDSQKRIEASAKVIMATEPNTLPTEFNGPLITLLLML
jgi:hypothetical protein